MCGIGGLVLSPPGQVKSEWIGGFLDHLQHRGPDDAGWLSSYRGKLREGCEVPQDVLAESLLVHRRLSILDLSAAGHQPMGTPDGRYWITYNGELYNYIELREELKTHGYTFRSHSDTEVLLAAYRQWGRGVLNRLVGMFAFAILDVESRRLFLARDFFGIKPLYYAFWRDGFVFASEIRPLLGLPGVTRDINAQRLYDYLCVGVTDYGGETMFAQVKQLPAAHCMELSLDDPKTASVTRYWNVDLTRRAELSFEEAAGRLRDLFIESVCLHLRSDVPIGCALSGGIDSSSIVSVMRLLDSKLEIHAFSYIADDPRLSEERWVDVVGENKQLVVHKVKLGSEELQADLDSLIERQGEPFMSTSMYAQWRVFQTARKAGVKVMLDGQGADELLGGYARHRAAMLSGLVRRGRFRNAKRLALSSSPSGGWRGEIVRAAARSVHPWMQAIMRRLTKGDATPSWVNACWFKKHGVGENDSSVRSGKRSLRPQLYRALTETSLPMLLEYEDRNSMAVSIESRVPFLTPAIASFVLSLPEDYLIAPDGTSKHVFRQAMRGIVPDQILGRRDKVGFPTPERDWLNAQRSFVERTLNSEAAGSIGALNMKEMLSEWEQMVQGRRQMDFRVWRWLNVILWSQRFSVGVA